MPASGNAEVRIVTGVRATSQCIAWIGARIGTFAKHGLIATFPALEVSGPSSVAGLLRGDWDFAQTGTVPVAEAVLNGGDAVILLRNSIRQDSIIIMTRREITGLGQLNGKTIGVLTDTYSGQTGVIVRLALERAGATATYARLGTYRNVFAALVAGDIDAGALPIDFQFLVAGDDRWNCFETNTLNVPAVFATTRRVIAADRERVLRVLRGFLEAVHRFKTDAADIVPLLQEFLGYDDRRAVERLHTHYASMLPLVPRPALADAMQALRDHLSGKYPAARGLQEADIADASLIEELEQSGFIARPHEQELYRRA